MLPECDCRKHNATGDTNHHRIGSPIPCASVYALRDDESYDDLNKRNVLPAAEQDSGYRGYDDIRDQDYGGDFVRSDLIRRERLIGFGGAIN